MEGYATCLTPRSTTFGYISAQDADRDLPLERDNRALTAISRYAGASGYGERFRKEDPEELFRDFRPTAEALLVYAEKRVRERLAEYERTRED